MNFESSSLNLSIFVIKNFKFFIIKFVIKKFLNCQMFDLKIENILEFFHILVCKDYCKYFKKVKNKFYGKKS